MKISTDTITLSLCAVLAVPFFSWRLYLEAPSTRQSAALHRTWALETQRTLDDMKSAVRDIRARSKQASPKQRATLERDIADIETLLQQTQKQLVLWGAEDEATRRLIEQSFPNTTTLEAQLWKSGG